MKKSELDYAVEQLIDASSVAEVLEALEQVCWAKSEHLATNWQDMQTAKAWRGAALKLAAAAAKISV